MRKAKRSSARDASEVETKYVLTTPAFAPTDTHEHPEFYVHRSKPVEGMHGYLLRRAFKFEPLIIGWSVDVPKLDHAQVRALENTFGGRLREEEVDWIDAALEQFVKAVVLLDRIVEPKEMIARVRECQTLLLSVKHLALILNPEEDDSLRRDHVSVDAMVGLLFSDVAQDAIPKMIAVNQMISKCDEVLTEMETRFSGRGVKKNFALSAFYQSIVTIFEFSGHHTALPSNSLKERFSENRPTILSQVTKQLLQFANELGSVSLRNADQITPAEKQRASKAFASYAKTSEGAVVDRLREAKREDFAYPRGRFTRTVHIDADDLKNYERNRVLSRDDGALRVGTKRP